MWINERRNIRCHVFIFNFGSLFLRSCTIAYFVINTIRMYVACTLIEKSARKSNEEEWTKKQSNEK